METFVVYDARREQIFVRFPHDGATPAESGHLDVGLWVEFGPGDPARMLLVTVEHPFFARQESFVERVAGLVGQTVLHRLRDCFLRDETMVGEVELAGDEIDALMAAWDGARRDLRARPAQAGVARRDASRPADAERHWLVPVRLEPVMARTTQQVAATGRGFDARVELPVDLADALRVEPTVRVSIAGRVLRLCGRVRDGEEPPTGVRLGLAGTDAEVTASYDAARGLLGVEMELGGPLDTLPDGALVSLLRLRVWQERTGNG